MRFLGKILLVVALCASGAWLVALVFAWLSGGEVEFIRSPWSEKPKYIRIARDLA
jgi:hypothetical protein